MIVLCFIGILLFLANQRIRIISEPYVFSELSKVPEFNTGLLLGTSKFLKNGTINAYYQNRILAADALFKAGKIKYIIISGDNSKDNYNEPLDMKNDLLSLGMPDSVIYLDYAGFRTFDSVIRAYKIFGQKQFVSISQGFHNERTVFIARHYGIEAYGYNAKDVNAYMGFKTKIREYVARGKVFIDFLFDKQPKYLGDPVHIGT